MFHLEPSGYKARLKPKLTPQVILERQIASLEKEIKIHERYANNSTFREAAREKHQQIANRAIKELKKLRGY